MATDYKKAYLEAKSQGYNDSDIAQHLGGDKYQEAKDAGYSDQEIINHFSGLNISSPSSSAPEPVQQLSEKVQSAGQPLFNALSKIQGSMPFVGSLMNPMEGAAMAYNNQLNGLTNKLGESVSEKLGQVNPNHPYVNAAGGMAASILSNPMTYASKAIPATEVPIVKPSQIGDVPFTLAGASGSPVASHLENFLANMPTSAGVIEDLRNATMKGIGNVMDVAQSKLGTSQPQHIVGDTMRGGLTSEQAANDALSEALYKKVPKDTQVPMTGFTKLFNQLADILPDNIKKFVNKYVQTDENPVRPGDTGEFKGVTKPGDVTPDTYGIGYQAAPGQPTQLSNAPVLDNVRQLRSLLTNTAQEGGSNGHFASLLKKAINNDLEAFATSDDSPIGSLVNKDAVQSLKDATNFYREKMQLQNHPLVEKLANRPISDLPDLIFKGGRVEDVQVAKAALGDVGYASAQKSFFTDLLHAKDVAKEISKYDPEFLKQALSENQLSALRQIDMLKKTALSSANKAPMTGSTRMNAILGMLGTTAAGAAHGGLPGAIAGATASMALPYLAAKGYGALSNGINASVGPATTTSMALVGGKSSPTSAMDVIRKYLTKRP